MEYTNLGRTGCKVSRLCLGTMNFGPHHRTRLARHHVQSPRPGHSILGHRRRLRRQTGRGHHRANHRQLVRRQPRQARPGRPRHQIPGQHGHRSKRQQGASAFHIRQACEASLRRLKTDRIDLYQMHHINRDCPWEEVYGASTCCASRAKIIYAGSSNFAGWHLAESFFAEPGAEPPPPPATPTPPAVASASTTSRPASTRSATTTSAATSCRAATGRGGAASSCGPTSTAYELDGARRLGRRPLPGRRTTAAPRPTRPTASPTCGPT